MNESVIRATDMRPRLGASYLLWGVEEPWLIRKDIDRMVALGATDIAIVPHYYGYVPHGSVEVAYPPEDWCDPDLITSYVGQDTEHPWPNTPSLKLIDFTARYAISRGLRVMLKPHVDFANADWRGDVLLGSLTFEWSIAYAANVVSPLVNLMKLWPGPVADKTFCLGCEYVKITETHGAEAWVGLANYIHRMLNWRGGLTYAANWGDAPDGEWTRLLDLWSSPYITAIGIDEYSPKLLAEDGDSVLDNPPASLFLDRWRTVMQAYNHVAAVNDKPVWFTEVGVGNHTRSALTPWKAGDSSKSIRDDEVQLVYLQAMVDAARDYKYLTGRFLWNFGRRNQSYLSLNLWERKAEAIIGAK